MFPTKSRQLSGYIFGLQCKGIPNRKGFALMMSRLFYAFGVTVLALLVATPVWSGEADIALRSGFRHDELRWSIGGGGLDVLSELQWKDLEIFQMEGYGRYLWKRPEGAFDVAVRASAGYGWIVHGKNRDSDYAGPDRSDEWSRSSNGADQGEVLDLSLAGGLQFPLTGKGVSITPLLGYSYHEQNLTLRDGMQVLSDQTLADRFFGAGEVTVPALGPFPGLDSTYATQWYGPWTGVEMVYSPVARFSLAGRLELHLVDFRAEADWNLRSDMQHPKSFVQKATGYGLVGEVTGKYALDSRWGVELALAYSDWRAEDGTDRIYLADGTRASTRLHEVCWTSLALNLGLVFRY